jgi:putative hydrolase of the HAD superfamily
VITDIIFDFFGTLVSYTPGAFHTSPYQRTHQFLLEHGFEIGYDDFVELFTAVSDRLEAQARDDLREYHMDDVGRAFFRSAFRTDIDQDFLMPWMGHFITEWSRGIRHLDGIAALLAQLASRHRLSILSNTHYPALIHGQLAAMKQSAAFAQVITSVEFGIRKPHQAVFQHALERLQILPEQALYVGDTYLDDYQGATGAGLRCILIDPKNQHPYIHDRIGSLFELQPFLERSTLNP